MGRKENPPQLKEIKVKKVKLGLMVMMVVLDKKETKVMEVQVGHR